MKKKLVKKEPNYGKLLAVAMDIVDSIENACWIDALNRKNLSGPTIHMKEACDNLKQWVQDSQVPTLRYRK